MHNNSTVQSLLPIEGTESRDLIEINVFAVLWLLLEKSIRGPLLYSFILVSFLECL